MAALCEDLGKRNALAISLDVTKPGEWRAALTTFHNRAGRLDVLVTNFYIEAG